MHSKDSDRLLPLGSSLAGHRPTPGIGASQSKLKAGVSFGVASAFVAGSFGTAGYAQDATELPPLEVTAKPAQKKRASAPKRPAPAVSAPAPRAATVPAPAPAPVAPVAAESGFGDGAALTPASGNTLQSGTGLGRLPGTLQDTPQTISVVPQQQIRE